MPPDILPALRAWLTAAPPLAGVARFWVDSLPAATAAGEAALFPQGVQVLARRADLLGRQTLRCRARFALRLLLPAPPGVDDAAANNAARLLALRRWVSAQSAARTAPVLGDDPAAESWQLADAHLESAAAEGMAVYRATLAAELVEIYEP